MKNKTKKIIVSIFFLCILVIGIKFIDRLFHTYDLGDYFYDLPENSLEVIHVGSSHSYCAFDVAHESIVIGADVINLSFSSMQLETMQFWIKELYKTQSPKVIAIELYSFAPYPAKIAHLRSNIDPLKFSINKINSIDFNIKYANLSPSIRLELLFPIISNHVKWKNINVGEKLDVFSKNKTASIYKGYQPSSRMEFKIENDKLFPSDEPVNSMNHMAPERMAILDEIIDICTKNQTKVIFVLAPYIIQHEYDYKKIAQDINGLKQYAKDNNIDIINYNNLTDEIGFDKTDMRDFAHLNNTGARKVSNHFANYINDNYFDLLQESVWDLKEETLLMYETLDLIYNESVDKKDRVLKEYKLNFINYPNNFQEYLNLLNDDNYTTIITTKNIELSHLDKDIVTSLENLGFSEIKSNNYNDNFIAIKNANKIFQKSNNNIIEFSTYNQAEKNDLDLPFNLEIRIATKTNGDINTISINTEDLSINKDGFNIVVYDNYLDRVVSQSNFNPNEVEQNYTDRNDASKLYNDSKVIYSLDTAKEIPNLMGASGSTVSDIGVIINSNSENPRFELLDYKGQSNHIIMKLEIDCPSATVFELYYQHTIDDNYNIEKYEKFQLVTGENTVFIQVESQKEISMFKASFIGSSGDYVISSLAIADLE